MIEARALTKRYAANVAVDSISFSVAKGEVLGLLGPNGAGKTTTMRMLTSFLPADSGSATVAGYDVDRDSLEVRRSIGYLPESAPLYHDMQVHEYLRFIARVRAIPRSQRAARLARMVEVCGLGSVIGKEIGELSKGFRQRVGLAQTLIHEPPILILDEPTTGLDPNQIVEIRDLVKEIGRERTIILSTHILSEVEATCSRVIIIDQGKVAASGTPRELARRATGGTHWVVRLSGDAETALARLRAIAGVTEVTVAGTPDRSGLTEVRVVGSTDDIGEAIFKAAVAGGFTLAELRRDAVSLESVFRTLTGKDKPLS